MNDLNSVLLEGELRALSFSKESGLFSIAVKRKAKDSEGNWSDKLLNVLCIVKHPIMDLFSIDSDPVRVRVVGRVEMITTSIGDSPSIDSMGVYVEHLEKLKP